MGDQKNDLNGSCVLLCPAGQLFPDNDAKWKGASSDIFVKEAVSQKGASSSAGCSAVSYCMAVQHALKF